MTSATPPQAIGRYEVLRELGRGGMGIVYEGFDAAFNRRVAIKVLVPPVNLDPQELSEFLTRVGRESRALGSLSHPNILHVYDLGEEARMPFIVMELLDGQSLDEALRAKGMYDFRAARSILGPVLEALHYVHKRGIIHRDIKPGNIQVCSGQQIKLMDFGIARILFEPTLTATGMFCGTAAYAPPEQIAGRSQDHRVDLYSLGVVAYQLMTGYRPFVNTDVIALCHAIATEEPTFPPFLGYEATEFLRRALQKEPGRRFQTATEMLDALNGSSQGVASVQAPPAVNRVPNIARQQANQIIVNPVARIGANARRRVQSAGLLQGFWKALQFWWKILVAEAVVAFLFPACRPYLLLGDVASGVVIALAFQDSRRHAAVFAASLSGLIFLGPIVAQRARSQAEAKGTAQIPTTRPAQSTLPSSNSSTQTTPATKTIPQPVSPVITPRINTPNRAAPQKKMPAARSSGTASHGRSAKSPHRVNPNLHPPLRHGDGVPSTPAPSSSSDPPVNPDLHPPLRKGD